VPSKSIMPNWLFAALMTVPVRTGVAAGDVELCVGRLVAGCNGVPLGEVGPGALGAPLLLSASPQPVMTMTHAASTAMRRIPISSLPSSTVQPDGASSRICHL
jgi:hypothetical protein